VLKVICYRFPNYNKVVSLKQEEKYELQLSKIMKRLDMWGKQNRHDKICQIENPTLDTIKIVVSLYHQANGWWGHVSQPFDHHD
jgi:hypothetical protein